MQLLVEVKDTEAAFLLELLQKFDFVSVQKKPDTEPTKTDRIPTFNATKIDTKGFKFNREEANQR